MPQPGFISRLEAYLRLLCGADWQADDGAVRLSRNLSLAAVQEAPFFHSTRQLMLALQEQGGTATTATGNLNRTFVRHMFERLTMSPLKRRTIAEMNKVINEQDLWGLHLSRIVAELSGLITKRSKQFKLTKQGTVLLKEENSGDLYRTLFITYFQKFDLRYGCLYNRDVAGIQQTMAAILWRMEDLLKGWYPVQGLAPKVLLPGVYNQLREAMASPYDTDEWILSGYVLKPLLEFGLIETKKKGDWPTITENDIIRITPLWKEFISFRPFE